jgi:signal transduction histidine kinase
LQADLPSRYLLHVQVFGDLVILVILLHYSGGIENPLSLIMLFHVIIGGIVLSRLQCFLVAAVGTLLFGLLALAEWAQVIEHYTLQIFPHFNEEGHIQHAAHESPYVGSRVGLQAVILFVTAYFVSTLVDRLRHDERQLEAMANRALADGQLLERSLETTGAALRVIDRNLKPRWSNSRWQAWLGSAGAMDGVGSAAQQTLRDGVTRTVELGVGASKDRVFQVTSAPLRDADGRVHQIVQLAQDVTDRRRNQTRLIRAGQLAAVGELAGQIAHEVNNPIAIISAKARLLLSDRRPAMSDDIAEDLDKIIHLADRVAGIAQGLLSYCRPSGAAREPLDLRAPIRSALAMARTRAKMAGTRVIEHLPDGLPPVRANVQELEQVFLNLFLNALDAMPRGGRLTVGIEPEPILLPDDKAALLVTVEDTGEGIPETVRERIFEPFFTTKGPGRGTGLGLSICQGLIRSHGGRIGLDHRVGPGTRFSVALPINSRDPRNGRAT